MKQPGMNGKGMIQSLKNLGSKVAGFLILLVVVACNKDADHYVRVKNGFTEPLKEVKLDAINFGMIDSAGITDYKYVLVGKFPVNITTESGLKTSGEIEFKGGEGKEYWTITINKNRIISAAQD